MSASQLASQCPRDLQVTKNLTESQFLFPLSSKYLSEEKECCSEEMQALLAIILGLAPLCIHCVPASKEASVGCHGVYCTSP